MRCCPEAMCGRVSRGKSVLQTGTTRLREVSARIGVTSDEAENAPRLRVANGEDSKESEPPVKRRVETHTARIQDSSTPVPWRCRSRGARIRGLIDRRVTTVKESDGCPVLFAQAETPGRVHNLRPGRGVNVDPVPMPLRLGPFLDLPGHQDFPVRRGLRRTLHPVHEALDLEAKSVL